MPTNPHQPTRLTIIQYMKRVVDNHVETLTGELNTTTLAEDALQEFDHGYALDEDLFFEYAHEIFTWYERTRKPFLC